MKLSVQNGFTLVEVLVGSAMLGIAAMSAALVLSNIYDITGKLELDNIHDNLVKARLMYMANLKGLYKSGCNPLANVRGGTGAGVDEWVEDGMRSFKGYNFCVRTAYITNDEFAAGGTGEDCSFGDTALFTTGGDCRYDCSCADPDGLSDAALAPLFASSVLFTRPEASYGIVLAIYTGTVHQRLTWIPSSPGGIFDKLLALMIPEAFAAVNLEELALKIKAGKNPKLITKVKIIAL